MTKSQKDINDLENELKRVAIDMLISGEIDNDRISSIQCIFNDFGYERRREDFYNPKVFELDINHFEDVFVNFFIKHGENKSKARKFFKEIKPLITEAYKDGVHSGEIEL